MRIGVAATTFDLKLKFNNMENDNLKHESSNANTLLCAGLCLKCQHQSYKSDELFQKTGRCMKKFWMDKPDKLSAKKPVVKCKFFEPCT